MIRHRPRNFHFSHHFTFIFLRFFSKTETPLGHAKGRIQASYSETWRAGRNRIVPGARFAFAPGEPILSLIEKERSMSRRAELLAARIEEGANALAAFAEKLTDAE